MILAQLLSPIPMKNCTLLDEETWERTGGMVCGDTKYKILSPKIDTDSSW